MMLVRGLSNDFLANKAGWKIASWFAAILAELTFFALPGAADDPPANPQPPMQPAAQASPADEALAILYEAKKAHAQVRDYTCTLVKREQINGALQSEQYIAFQFRNQPFSVYMKWFGPKELAGQEACYVHGKNQNKMRVQAKGFIKGVVGFVSISTNDSRVMAHSRHTILEAGVGNLIEQNLSYWQRERSLNQTQFKISHDFEFDKRKCIRIEATHTAANPQFYCYRSVLYVDKENKLPIRAENYDWPHQGGAAGGNLLEMYSYVGLRLNVDLPDSTFSK